MTAASTCTSWAQSAEQRGKVLSCTSVADSQGFAQPAWLPNGAYNPYWAHMWGCMHLGLTALLLHTAVLNFSAPFDGTRPLTCRGGVRGERAGARNRASARGPRARRGAAVCQRADQQGAREWDCLQQLVG